MLYIGFAKQTMDMEGVFSSLFNLANYQSLLSNLVPLGPSPKLSSFLKYTRIKLILVSFLEL